MTESKVDPGARPGDLAARQEPTDDDVLTWVGWQRIMQGLYFDRDYERPRVEGHREDMKRTLDSAIDWKRQFQRICEVAASNLERAEQAEKQLAEAQATITALTQEL